MPVDAMAAPGLWNAVVRAPLDEAAREKRLAQSEAPSAVAPPGPVPARRSAAASAKSEAHLRRALQISPADFEARRQLAEVRAATGRPRDAAREFEAARPMAPTPADEARIWFRLANERSRMGAYDDALDAYDRQLALGDLDAGALGNSAELLMAAGRLPEAIDRYREALAIEERERDRRGHIQTLALGYFGLAVALDRDGREVASREAIGRALALDAGLAVLRLAQQENGDLFLIPRGDVFYYIGLAREAQGRPGDAGAAFRDYLGVPAPRFARRAREHLARLGPVSVRGQASERPLLRGATPAPTSGVRLRVIHQATLGADGPLVAPLIDAAWRLDGRLLDDCLSDVLHTADRPGVAPVRTVREFRLSLELTIDETGRATAVKVHAPAELGTALGPCIEGAIRSRFQVTRPARRKPTKARMELVLAPVEPSGV